MFRTIPPNFDGLVRLGGFRVCELPLPKSDVGVRRLARQSVAMERLPPESNFGTPLVEQVARAHAEGRAAADADVPRDACPYGLADQPLLRRAWMAGMDEWCAECETDA